MKQIDAEWPTARFLLVTVLLSAVMASATTTTEKWPAGWLNFSEPLNFTHSTITSSVSTTRKLDGDL